MTAMRFGKAAGVLLLLLVVAACGDDAPDTTVDNETGLTTSSYERYKDEIGPQPSDAAWQQIDWLPSYTEGLEAADAEQKPILLWVMNGHPLGCT